MGAAGVVRPGGQHPPPPRSAPG